MIGESNKLRLHENCAAEESRDGYRLRKRPQSNIAVCNLAPRSKYITLVAREGII